MLLGKCHPTGAGRRQTQRFHVMRMSEEGLEPFKAESFTSVMGTKDASPEKLPVL